MDVMSGKVVDGKVVVEGVDLPEGKTVGVFFDNGDSEPVKVSPEEEAELLDSIAAVKRGEYVDGYEHLRKLRNGG